MSDLIGIDGKNWTTAALAGRCTNGYERDRGHVVHWVPYNRTTAEPGGMALCKKTPGARSVGFSSRDGDPTCPACIKLMSELAAKEPPHAPEPAPLPSSGPALQFIDGVAMHKEHPDTFYIPPDEEKAAVRPGHYVKAGFRMEGFSSERMWLIVTRVAPDGSITGILDNDPVALPLTIGDTFTVRPEHILSLFRGCPHDA